MNFFVILLDYSCPEINSFCKNGCLESFLKPRDTSRNDTHTTLTFLKKKKKNRQNARQRWLCSRRSVPFGVVAFGFVLLFSSKERQSSPTLSQHPLHLTPFPTFSRCSNFRFRFASGAGRTQSCSHSFARSEARGCAVILTEGHRAAGNRHFRASPDPSPTFYITQPVTSFQGLFSDYLLFLDI